MNKQSFITILLTVLTSMVCSRAFAYDIVVDGIYYSYINDHELMVTNKGTCPTYSGTVIIPETVTYNGTTYSVTGIGGTAFALCENLYSVTIPNSVISIGSCAFEDCDMALNKFILGKNVKSIGSGAFSGSHSLGCEYFVSLIEDPFDYTFPYWSSYDCGTLIVPKGSKAKYMSLKGWREYFQTIIECDKKRTIHVSTAGTLSQKISDYEKYFLEELTITGYLNGTDIAFIRRLAGAPVNYNYIGGGICKEYEKGQIYGNLAVLDISGATIVSGGDDYYKGWVEPDLAYEYYRCVDDESTSNNTISRSMFKDCKFTKLSLPNNITTIEGDDYDRGSFVNCERLTEVVIPQNVTSIGNRAFVGCSGLTSIKVESGNNKYDSRNNCNAIIEKSTNTLITGCKNTIIPNSVTSIGYGAFSGCGGLTSVTIPNSVTSIGNKAFESCGSLKSVTIGKGVTSIGALAFYGCSSLNAVHISDLAAWCNIDFCDENRYDYLSNPLVYANHLYLNDSKVEELVIPDGVTEIKAGAFFMGNDITSVEFPNNVTSIGHNSFAYCNLSSLEIPNEVTYVGYGSFKYNQNMTSVTIPNSVTFIGGWAFGGCSSLTSVTIPNSVTGILEFTFEGCENLTSVTIPSSVTSIDNRAFFGCSNLTSITIPNSVTSIGYNVFNGCNNLQYICLTSDVFPNFSTDGINSNCQFVISQKAYESGIPSSVTNFATYSDTPMFVQMKSKTATSAVFELRPVNDPDNTTYTVTTYGQTPGQNLRWKLDDQNYGIVSEKADGTLTMETQEAQAMSTNKARLSASVSEPDDDQHYGFEWLRYDAPEGMNPYQVSAPLYNGQIVGALGGLNSDKYYKYRPYYKSDDGTIFRGEWKIFTTGDYYVFFDPDVHTKEPVAISNAKIILLLFYAEGTEEILEKGFELIKKAIESLGTRADGGDITTVTVNGNEMSATVEGLEPGTEYICRSYVKTSSGTTYGEEVTFKTPLPGDANNDDVVNAADIVEIVNTKSGNPSVSFNMTNADMDGNGKLTEADINAIVSKIMQK